MLPGRVLDQVQCLTKVRLTEIVKDYPREAKIIRKAAILMAFQRAVKIFIQNFKVKHKRTTLAASFMRHAHHQIDDSINRQYRRASRLEGDVTILVERFDVETFSDCSAK